MQQYLPLAVLKHIEAIDEDTYIRGTQVATVLTACGIETMKPFTASSVPFLLQQYLPLAVLKRKYRFVHLELMGCNSTYRLRY